MTQNINKLSNRIAMITGAASGIGKEVAIRLASEGCKLCLVDLNQDKLAELLLQLRGQTELMICAGDVTDANFIRDVVTKIEK